MLRSELELILASLVGAQHGLFSWLGTSCWASTVTDVPKAALQLDDGELIPGISSDITVHHIPIPRHNLS